ncbi:ATP-binding domain-containing protein [Limosilactobacillus fermentum]|uniref:RNA polymerase recycling motor HelD n=1 Tax=Limosilactobacillus fermentum TaxID=1613 RepID=UPI00097F3AA1|nr:RNA polymerase recycling motor HelD [Limosilactobacillus fermentum]SJM46300.1 DNA helicase [Limosilactobacillus fermentum]SJM47630.1 DNA helicase [Limosilactobacillus fermentum]
MTDATQAREQAHLDQVIDRIKAAEQEASQKIQSAKKDIDMISGDFNEIRMNTTTYSGMMDTAMSVRAQQQLLDERENSWQHAADRLGTFRRLEAKPYFARIDFTEEAGQIPETIYIGLASFADSPDHFLVYDWRAPISSIYYEGELGEVSYDTPDGQQTVNVKLKRQFQIEDGVIVTLYDTAETVTDQMLLAALNNHSSTKMKSIVTTIQRTQNRIIRNTDADLLFVQGAAGSGKTAAVLQRVAWLLYRYRGNLNSSQVILFSPNQLFNDYIDQVLPELGEHNMVQLTYYQYVNRRVPRLQVASIQERFDADQEGVNARASQLLTSLTYFNAVTRYAKRLGRDGHLHFKNLMFNKKAFFSKDKIAELYYSFNQNYNLGNRLDATKQELVKMLNRRISGEMRSKWVEERIQTLSKEELDVIYHEYGGEFKDEEAENKYLARRIVMEAFKPIKKAIDHNRWMNINAQYIHLLRVTPKLVKLADFGLTEDEWAGYVDDQLAALKKKRMSANGISVYLYLYDLLTGKRGQREIRFVFVDEVQDYDAFQLAYLKFCFPKARFTLLGDLNQAIFTHNNARSLLQQLGTMFDPEKTKVIQLTRSYRSTKQITNFTKAILKDGEAIEAFEREGELPRVLTAPSEEDAVNQVVATLEKYQADHDTTTIITKTLTDAEKITALLKEAGQAVTLIQTENQRLAQGTIVVPSYLAKGLEFDAVIVWDANQAKYQGDAERQLVYTICSRAMHALTVTSVGPVTDLIGQIPGELYQTK